MCSKVAILLALVVYAYAGNVGHYGGVSHSSRKQDDHGNYAFGYQIVDGHGSTHGRQEVGDGKGHVVGSYNLGIIDGRKRAVHYVADGHGFHATVKTNEPGTAHSLPAAAVIASPYHGAPSGGVVVHKAVVPVHVGYGGYGAGYGGYGAGFGGYGAGFGGYGAGYGGYGAGFGGYGGHGGYGAGYGGFGGYGFGKGFHG